MSPVQLVFSDPCLRADQPEGSPAYARQHVRVLDRGVWGSSHLE